jgi:hypothetical protein
MFLLALSLSLGCRFEHVEGRTKRAHGAHAHGAYEPPERGDAPLWAEVDVRGRSEGHIARVGALKDVVGESTTFSRAGRCVHAFGRCILEQDSFVCR